MGMEDTSRRVQRTNVSSSGAQIMLHRLQQLEKIATTTTKLSRLTVLLSRVLSLLLCLISCWRRCLGARRFRRLQGARSCKGRSWFLEILMVISRYSSIENLVKMCCLYVIQ